MVATLLKGTAYLTGAASGIGRATAIAFVRSGIQNLALTDINESNLQKVQQEINAAYPKVKVHIMKLNVRDTDEVDRSVLKAVEMFGRIDIAVNVAGIGGNGAMTHEVPEGDWERVVDVNLNGVWRCQRAQLRAMMQQENLGLRKGRGSIVNVASMYGLIAPPASIPATEYTASKHAVVGLTRSDASSYGPHGIRINAMCPGYIETPLNPASATMTSEVMKTPMGRMGSVEEIADCIVFLSSEMASYVTGSILVSDGGHTMV
ncbi:3-oxoacyl-reductase [Calycina marina]|uniref:3-oxoacyl-reductase n=1 Tax=Calycina marina TaxID=1763456 RepID=A0A9P7Z915_9HELO|nr:3-oxoacyl-reductase [Calycina marina]